MIISMFSFLLFMFIGGGLFIFCWSSFNVIIMWFSLELLSWGMLPFFLFKKSLVMKESMMKYFIIQSLASILFFLSCFLWEEMMFIFLNNSWFWEMILLFSFLLKMGMFPFHGWFLEILSESDFIMGFMMLAIQKIIPFFIILKLGILLNLGSGLKVLLFSSNLFFIMFTIANIHFFLILMGLSGIYHFTILFFMISLIGMSKQVVTYFIFYFIFLMGICLFQQKFFFFKKITVFSNNLHIYFLSFLILSGLPPFFMFFVKSLFLYSVVSSMSDLFILVLISLISIYIFSFLSIFWESMSNNTMIVSNDILFSQKSHLVSMKFMWLFLFFSIFLTMGLCLIL